MPQARPPATNMMPPPSSAPATPRPTRSNSTSTSSGTVNHTVCERKPMLSAARNAPITIIRPDAAVDGRRQPPIAVGPRPLPPPRRPSGTPARPTPPPVPADRSSADAEIPEQRARRGDRGRGERLVVNERCATGVAGGGSCRSTDTSIQTGDRQRARRAATARRAPAPRSPMAARRRRCPVIAVAILPSAM